METPLVEQNFIPMRQIIKRQRGGGRAREIKTEKWRQRPRVPPTDTETEEVDTQREKEFFKPLAPNASARTVFRRSWLFSKLRLGKIPRHFLPPSPQIKIGSRALCLTVPPHSSLTFPWCLAITLKASASAPCRVSQVGVAVPLRMLKL